MLVGLGIFGLLEGSLLLDQSSLDQCDKKDIDDCALGEVVEPNV